MGRWGIAAAPGRGSLDRRGARPRDALAPQSFEFRAAITERCRPGEKEGDVERRRLGRPRRGIQEFRRTFNRRKRHFTPRRRVIPPARQRAGERSDIAS